MKQYHDLIREVLSKGTRKENRTGIDTISTFNYNYEIDLNEGFPLLTTKEISWKNIVIENLWFLSGNKSIHFLQQHGCKFWDPWANKWGEVPSAYGHYWRQFPGEQGTKDQVKFVIDELKRNPMSRRLVVSAWAPENALVSALPPCHLLYIFNVQNIENGPILNLHLTQRSADVALGVPYNIAGYALILELMSRFTGIKPGIFAHTLIDAHIYTAKADGSKSEYDHIPGLESQLQRALLPLPKLTICSSIQTLEDVEKLMSPTISTEEILNKFKLEGYNPYPPIKFKVAV